MADERLPIFLATFYTDKTLGEFGLGKLNEVGRAIGAVQAYHRANLPQDGEAPYAVANEFICSEFGRLAGLSIPPGALTTSTVDRKTIMFSCLDFESSFGELVNAESDRCCELLLEECTGLALFDMIIANPDRESWNLRTNDSLSPTFIRVFDHADALFNVVGKERFDKQPLWSGLSWPPPRREKESHFLLPNLCNGEFFARWCDKFHRIPSFQIKNIFSAARRSGITAAEAKAAYDFIMFRKNNIQKIAEANRSLFCSSFFDPPEGALV